MRFYRSRVFRVSLLVSLFAVAIAFSAAAPRQGSIAAARKAAAPAKAQPRSQRRPAAVDRAAIAKHFGALPLSFEPNVGQTDSSVRYISHGPGYTLLLTGQGAELALDQPDEAVQAVDKMDEHTRKRFESRRYYQMSPRFHRKRRPEGIRVTLQGANPSPAIASTNPLKGTANYFLGKDPKGWRTGIPTYGRVKYSNIYPGTNLVYYGRQGRLEFDFIVEPGADPNNIRLHFDALGPLSITKDGTLTVATETGPLELFRPTIYQLETKKRVPVVGRFSLQKDKKTVAVQVAEYDHSKPLVIDPVLSYSTYLGGNGSDYDAGVAVDSKGDTYIAGQTTSTNFPANNGFASSGNSNGVAFVTELNPTGTAVLYSTYLGGTGGDWGAGLTIDPSGNVYVTGSTLSTDFPVVNGIQSSLQSSNGNAFVARIDPTQSGASSLYYSTYLGGGSNASNSLGDVGLAIAADTTGLAYVTGQTASDMSSVPFPTTSNALQSSLTSVNGNAFFTVLDTTNGGSNSLIYSTYLGGGSTGFGDYGLGIAVDGSGDAYLTGQTTSGGSSPFPTTSGAYQTALNSQYGNVFISEIATAQNSCQCLVYSSYLGGSSSIIVGDEGSGIGLDATGKIYVGGDTTSADFPVTSGAYQTTNSAAGKGFIAAFDPTKAGGQSLVYSTLLGGTNGGEGEVINALTVDTNGDAFVAGSTSSSDFPTTAGALQTVLKNPSWDAFLSELNPSGTSLLYSTYFGGSCANGDLGNGVALDWLGNPYLAGSTCSSDLSVYPANAYQASLGGTYNTFVAKIASNSNPGIMATTSPAPNSSSWNNSPVIVSFACIPGAAPIQTCPSEVAVTTEGTDQIVSGTVIDTSNNSAAATDAVNLDMTPPAITITSPTDGTIVNSTSVTVTGTITDVLSGVSGVACNGQPAAINSSSFSCLVPISSGSNTVSVTGTDVAGNTDTSTISVNLFTPGGFASTNNLNVARQGHTATLLTNGTVLIAGGEDANGVDQATAEIYNPATATFTATGSMTVARMNHTATLLNDGTVLITGGYDSNYNPLTSAEIYNPAGGTFSAVANMSSGRASHTATLLQDGTVLIAGGYDSNFNALSSAELYNPAAATFRGVGSLVTGRVSHTATLLNDGQVLIVGGEDTNYDILDSAELYNPTAQTFAATGSLNIGRYLHSATLLNNGQVLIAAGEDPSYSLEASAELFDPNTGTFSFTGSLGTARDSHTATLLTNGTILIAGGMNGNYDTLGSTEIYDPVAQVFSASGNVNTSRSNQTATLLTDGTVLLAGGYESTGGFDPTLASSEIYQPTSVAPPNLVSIALNPSAASVGAGTSQRFTATGTFSDNSTEVLSSAIWSSSNNTIATVTNDWSNQGAVFGVAPGPATLSACTGAICGSTALTVTAAQLSITGLSPVAGDIGTQVIVSGSGFGATQGSNTVAFNGTAAIVSLWSGTAVIVTVPVGATSGSVVVTVGGTNSNGASFTVTSGPVITGIFPAEGAAGATVTISGTNFGVMQGSGTVTFNGLPATVSSWTNSLIGVNVPNGATTGNVVVMASGLASNAMPFTIPVIAQIAPNTGPVGTLVTIEGSGFGATQGSGTVSINGTPMQVVSWSDTVISAAVANGTSSGPLAVQQGSFSLTGPTFTINTSFPYNVSPQTLSLVVGQSQALSAPTGLHWITGNSSVVSLSTDDPPILTGVAAGSTTVYAGVVPISVTVYAGSFPTGTVIWSLPVTGQNPSVVSAVPSNSGADVFVLSGGTLSAVTPGGATVWQTPTNAENVIPDFSGSAYLYHSAGFCDSNGLCSNGPHSVGRLDPVTHQETLIYNFSSEQDPELGSVTNPEYDDRLGTEAVIPDASGNLFIEDINKVAVFNPAGQQIASIPLESSTVNCPPNPTGVNLPNAACPSGTAVTLSPVEGKMIVAGDGNAYVPYLYAQHDIGNLVLLRVSPDGSYAKIPLNTFDSELADQLAVQWTHAVTSPSALSVITNGDEGVAVFSPAGIQNTPEGNIGISAQLTYVSGDSITASVSFPFGRGYTFWPQLQRADGTYIGTMGPYIGGGEDFNVNPAATPVNENSGTVEAVGAAGILWTQQFGTVPEPNPVLPIYATSDGGVTVTSTQRLSPECGCAGSSVTLGTLYALDSGGNVISQSADSGAMQTWTGNWYLDPPGTISQIVLPTLQLATSFSPVLSNAAPTPPGANASGNGAAVLKETLYLRSFAPFQWFGAADPNQGIVNGIPVPGLFCPINCFAGDNRSFTTSTDPSVTSRVNGLIQFTLPGMAVISSKVYSNQSRDVWGYMATACPAGSPAPPRPTGLCLSTDSISTTRLSNGGFSVHETGSNPLFPLAPTIDLHIDIYGSLNGGQSCYAGHLYGDAFPDAEAFTVNSQNQATMLVTFATSGDPNTGPIEYLPGDFKRDMGSFPSTCTPY